MKAWVNEDECIGCEACIAIADDVFRLNSNDKAEAYGDVTDANRERVQEAIDTCPVSAISMED